MVRRTVFYSGRVQGVGFRYTTCRVAERFRVVGFVRNLSDGRVQVVVEGQSAEIERFLAALGAEMGSHIRNQECEDSAGLGEFDRFDVRF